MGMLKMMMREDGERGYSNRGPEGKGWSNGMKYDYAWDRHSVNRICSRMS